MLRCVAVIFLSLAVLAANAYCACVPSAAASTPKEQPRSQKPLHLGCHGHGEQQQEDSGHDQHDCGHCQETVSASTLSTKSTVPADVLSPLYCAARALTATSLAAGATRHCLDHSGLSPPVFAPTLLSLACSFTI